MSLAEHKVEALIKEGKFGSKALKQIKQNSDKLLITILIWNNLVNVYTAALATSIAISLADASWLPQASAIGMATWVITFLLLLFWEIIPKSVATKNAARISLFVAPIYKVLLVLLYPIILVIEFIIRVFTPKWTSAKMTEEEIESFIDMWREHGSLEEDKHERIKNILELDDTIVEEIMVPRVKIEALSSDTTVKEALDYYLTHTHSRIPVYNETIDNIYYFVTPRDLIDQVNNGNADKKLSELKLKKVMKIPLNQSVLTLFESLQKAHKVMAIVIDEYGWVSWIVTMEDIMEEVFGEIRDETDKEIDEIVEVWNGTLICQPDVLVEDVLDMFDLDLPHIWLDEREFDWETLSYVITHVVEWFPSNWEILTFDIVDLDEELDFNKLEFKVLEIKDHKLWSIEVKKIINK